MLTAEIKLFDGRATTSLLRLNIVNDLTGSPDLGNYRVTVSEADGPDVAVRVLGHPRKAGAARLVRDALSAYLEVRP